MWEIPLFNSFQKNKLKRELKKRQDIEDKNSRFNKLNRPKLAPRFPPKNTNPSKSSRRLFKR